MRRRAKQSNIAAAVRIALLSSCPWLAAHAGGPLPVACPGGPCGAGVPFASYGTASYAASGTKGTVIQSSTNAILNWQSFNIGAGNTVQFVQPSTSSVALNEIYDSNPTQIFGALNANGHIFLINQNGIVFGANATVNVGGLVASTLQITSSAAVTSGTATNYYGLIVPGQSGDPAFQAVTDANGNVLSQAIVVEQGASVESADGGQIYMFAPRVANLGTIQTPGGQTILAAGTSVYLAETADPNLRGLLVEVQGTQADSVTNGQASDSSVKSPQQLVGQIIAQDGNISLAALAVNQYGRLNATTSVSENGSIYLEAKSGTVASSGTTVTPPLDEPNRGGTLVLGQNSDTEVTLDSSDPTKTVDTQAQPKSTIEMEGATIQMLQDSVARATGGVVNVYAAQDLASTAGGASLTLDSGTSDGSRFYMAAGAELDVSGASIALPVSDNVISAQLLATELADSPDQRGGPLQGQTIYFDINAHGVNADGSTWWGTPLADVEGEILAIGRNVVERNLEGGTVNIASQGDVILAPTSTIDVAGGYVQYTGGYLDTSDLLTAWGQTVPIASANPDFPYAGIANTDTTTDAKWGVTETYQATPSYYSPGFVQGYDAGTLTLSAPAFIFDSTVSASTVIGSFQTLPTTPIDSKTWVQEATSTGTEYGMYRPYDEVPAGATLVIGTPGGKSNNPDLVVGSITITSGDVLPGLQNADGSAFNPLTDPLPASFTASILQPSLLEQFQNVSVYTNGNLTEAPGVDLSLSPGGGFTAQAASIDIGGGGINAPSGTIDLTAESTFAEAGTSGPALVLGPSASLTAVGAWINESTTLYPNGNTAPVYINGGSVSLSAAYPNDTGRAASMQLDPGSLIDVSAGAELTSSGTLDPGVGGSIKISDSTAAATNSLDGTPLPAPALDLGASLRGFALYQGGSLSISAAGVCIAASNCSTGNPTVLWLTPQFFNSGGFESYSIAGDQNGLTLAPGTGLDLVQENLELASDYQKQPDAASLEGFTSPAVLPLQARKPVDLTLSLEYPANETVNIGTGFSNVFEPNSSLPSLVIPQGDVISTDPLGAINLLSNTTLDVEGQLQAPGGSISLTLAQDGQVEFDPAQAIWLGPHAVLDASGAAQIFPNSMGNPTGSVLPGGTVSLDSQIGSIELLPGSLIDVNGTSGMIDIMPVGGGRGQNERIASEGGTIQLTAAAGMVVGGSLEGAAGAASAGAGQPVGGTLDVSLNPTGTGLTLGGNPATDEILLSPSLAPTVVAPGSTVPDSLLGLALLPTSAWPQGGFGTIYLQSTLGTIAFSGGATLTASYEAYLDAATYTVSAGTTGSVEAPYVEFGNSYSGYANSPTATAAPGETGINGTLSVSGGTGTLDVSGGFVELYGTSSLSGIGTANFDSSGDLRARGIQYGTAGTNPTGTISGALYADGNINLTADQIYPATLTQFVISADPAMPDPTTTADLAALTRGSITVRGSEGKDTDLLSAGGSLTLSAALIIQDGVLRAPFGTIALDAVSLTLGADSLTSTSANGLTIPFGETQGNTQGGAQNTYDWVYALENSITAVYGTDGVPPPSQHIDLNATNIDVQTGAVIDVSGGGDLQAYEWVPGPDGTNDVLGSSTSFAIIPGLNIQVAPYDPSMSAGAKLQPGESVYLSGGSGAPAGTYVLLPARYALLPGAFLVTPETGSAYQDMQPGQTFEAGDGGTIVSGYVTIAGLSYASSRLNGFDVTPSSDFLNEAQYNLATGNGFFSGQITAAESDAAAEAVSAMRLPQDAGVLAINAGSSLTLDGTLTASGVAGVSGARGAEVDISNPDIVVAANTSGASVSGALVLTTSSLNSLGAQTLLLGGENTDGTIATTAQSVTVTSGATLMAPQVLLTAENQISVENGAAITATGTAPTTTTLALAGSGAFLAVSAGPQATLTAATPSSGTLDLASGSSLTASNGSIYLDATAGITTDGAIATTNGHLAVQAPIIALGSAPNASGTTILGQNVLQGGDLAGLLLKSSAPIAVYAGGNVSAQDVTIDAPGLVSAAPGQSVMISATGTAGTPGMLTLNNSSGTAASSSGTQSGSLTFSAADITLQSAVPTTGGSTTPPTFGIEGFGSVALDAQNTLTAANDIDFSTDGNLSITASALTTGAGATATIAAAGSVTALAPSTPSAPASAALGGALSVTGSTIDLATKIDMPSGDVALTAKSGDITLESGGQINVAGVVQQYGTNSVATPGGHVALSATGNINLASGSSIDVSAGTGGFAGSLSISAPTGSVTESGSVAGSGAAQGGSFSVEAQSFAGGFGDCVGFCAISTAVNAGGFSDAQSYWLRGSGDLTLASGATLTASTVLLEADQGDINIDGMINASGTASGTASSGKGGSVTLSAGDGITVGSSGVIDAQATSAGGKGGVVEFDLGNNPSDPLTPATLTLSPGSQINVSGGGLSTASAGPDTDADVVLSGLGGTVLLRIPFLTVENVANGSGGITLKGTITGDSTTVLEAYDQVPLASDTTDVTIDASGNVDIVGVSGFEADASNIVAEATPAVEQLNAASGLNMTLEPGIEIDGPGNVTLDTPWDLSSLSSAGVPGILTLRAGGSVTFNDSLSDGITPSGTLLSSASWSYRIVAGANLSAANPLATASSTAQASDITIGSAASGAMVRTGTGFIDVAASGDLILANPDSVLYTAGEQDTDPNDPTTQSEKPTCGGNPCGQAAVKLPPYAVDGGNIDINVDGNVDGSASMDQFVNDWLWRQGGGLSGPTGQQEAPVAWSVQFADFDQDVGALAGGDVTVHAGGNIDDFSASIASIGVGEAGGSVDVKDGGTLAVSAGGSILGGSYYVGAGSMTLTAGNSALALGNSVGTDTGTGTSPLIGLGEASVSVTARGDLQVSGIVNPTLLGSGASDNPSQSVYADEKNYFSTYGSASSAGLTAIGGSVRLDNEWSEINSEYKASFYDGAMANLSEADTSGVPVQFDALAPVLDVYALSGDVDISRDLTLFPSSQDNLSVFAAHNVNLEVGSGSADLAAQVVVPDVGPSQMPSIGNPADDSDLTMLGTAENAMFQPDLPDLHGTTPLFSSVSSFDESPVQIVASGGNITFTAGAVGLWSGKPLTMSAGGDIVDANIYVQNLNAADVTSITAGGDITYPQTRSPTGGIATAEEGITVAGPGQLQISAGRNVNLGASSGIVTIGNQDNSALSSAGAGVSVEAGVGPVSPTAAEYSSFIQQYIDGSSSFDGQLVTYVEGIMGQTGLTDAEAKQEITGMTSEQQRTFIEQLFFYMLQTYGTEAVKSGDNADYAGAYAAIQTLFPGGNAPTSATNPYSGNISLYFSQIYTKDGGNISLLAPGGEVNAGLAVAPTGYGISKAPEDLGIVAESTGSINSFSYGDFEVNESRVFAADGGDILVWSTEGDIDAGRGSKTSLSASAPTVTYDDNGFATVKYYPPNTGSGIQALADTPGVSAGTVYLFAPHGVVNANEGGIVAGNLVIGATAVLGTNNIQVSGTTFGVPTAVTGLGTVALAGSTSAASATTTAQSSIGPNNQQPQQEAPKAAAELRWLDVFVLGFGEQTCSANDIECLKRQKHTAH